MDAESEARWIHKSKEKRGKGEGQRGKGKGKGKDKTSDFRFQIPDRRFQISDHPIANTDRKERHYSKNYSGSVSISAPSPFVQMKSTIHETARRLVFRDASCDFVDRVLSSKQKNFKMTIIQRPEESCSAQSQRPLRLCVEY